MQRELIWDAELIQRYNRQGPRYTSYPTAVEFTPDISQQDYIDALSQSAAAARPLSLYLHIPFCAHVCYYCGCNKIVTKHRSEAHPYLERLHREIEMQSALTSSTQEVEQLHWGGGTPTFLNNAEMSRLMEKIHKHFTLIGDNQADYSIEIDPREADWAVMGRLRDLGFNRVSIGVQDFDPKVQAAVNRVQSKAQTLSVIEAARALSFRSINLDLIYGLPHQSVASFMQTLDQVIAIRPDRLSVFNYAHLPERFKPQRRINEADLPSPQEKLQILEQSIMRLLDAGYVYIGMDHFALPDDSLARAQEEGELHRNFQGYTTHGHCDLIGMGVSSIGQIGDLYAQNSPDIALYQQAIDQNQFAIRRGLKVSQDDRIRRSVITELICHFDLDFSKIEMLYQINFNAYFEQEIEALVPFFTDKLIQRNDRGFSVTPRGRLLIRNICMVFDRYLHLKKEGQHFSKVI